MKKPKLIQTVAGQFILGDNVAETDEKLTLNNPVIIHFQLDGNNIRYNPFPLFFLELVAENSRECMEWTFDKRNIVDSNIQVSDDIVEKCSLINKVPEKKEEPKIISVTDL